MEEVPIQKQSCNKEQEQHSAKFDSFFHVRGLTPYIRKIT